MITFNPAYNINFKSYRHEILDKYGNVINRADTCMFRWDLDFDYLINFMEYKYRDADKVNIIAHACSDGEEIYSFISKLIDSLGLNNAEKYLPVMARDIEPLHIAVAKKAEYRISPQEEPAIDYYLGENFFKYFNYISPNIIKPVSNLSKYVNFAQSDIMEDAKTLDFKNTVLLARNFWHYLGDDNIYKLAKILSERMDKSSTLVTGGYDQRYGVENVLLECGFCKTRLNHVFEKI